MPLSVWTETHGTRRLSLPEFLGKRHMKVVRLSALGPANFIPSDTPGNLFC